MCFEIRKQKVFRGEDRHEMKLIEMKWNVMRGNETDSDYDRKMKTGQVSSLWMQCAILMMKWNVMKSNEMKWNVQVRWWNEKKCNVQFRWWNEMKMKWNWSEIKVQIKLKWNETKWKQAGAEHCQAQHGLWKILLGELDIDQLVCLSLHKYWTKLWISVTIQGSTLDQMILIKCGSKILSKFWSKICA